MSSNFKPEEHGCKIPQERLLKLLEGFGGGKIGMDCSIVPLQKFKDLYQVSTTDFFFPLVDDPYIMGKIAACNVLSDLYALGVEHCDNMLMLLSSCRTMTRLENDVMLRNIIQGFNDVATEAGTEVTGGQTVQNEAIILGGVAMSVCSEEHFIRPENAEDGDLIVLTKPLGTQVSVNAHEWLHKDVKKLENILKENISKEDIIEAYEKSSFSMSRLNKNGAKLMHKYKAHCCTDVTGFGILGHGTNLVENQKQQVDFVIEKLPIIKHMIKIDETVNNMFRLKKGYSAETSGGLFICLPKENAENFCKEIEQLDNSPAWIIGKVIKGSKKAKIIENVEIIEV